MYRADWNWPSGSGEVERVTTKIKWKSVYLSVSSYSPLLLIAISTRCMYITYWNKQPLWGTWFKQRFPLLIWVRVYYTIQMIFKLLSDKAWPWIELKKILRVKLLKTLQYMYYIWLCILWTKLIFGGKKLQLHDVYHQMLSMYIHKCPKSNLSKLNENLKSAKYCIHVKHWQYYH